MPHGGSRKGAGRPPGALNRVSRQQRQGAAADGLLPHEFLLLVTRGDVIDGYTPTFADRLEAAKAAAPFYAPKLSSMTAILTHQPAAALDDDDLDRRIAELEAQIADGSAREAEAPRGPGLPH